MAIDLNTLTSPATSGDVLAEALTTADFLEPVPVLRNLARGSQKGGDAKQDVALNQPKALPLTADSNGVVGGYLYQPDVTGNAPAVNIPSIAANEDFVFEMEVYLVNATNFHLASGADANNRFGIYNNGFYFSPEAVGLTSPLSTGASTLTVERSGTTATLKQNGVTKATHTANISDNTYTFTHLSFNGQFGTSIGRINGYIKKATLSIEGTQVFNIDFTATNVRHGDTKFACATGQVVTINKSGNDPATIIKKPVLRFDGTNDGLRGLFNQTITEGYIFVAFTVLGDGGKGHNGRVFSLNSTGGTDNDSTGYITGYGANPGVLHSYSGSNFTNTVSHPGLYSEENGDILHEHKFSAGAQLGKVNNADVNTGTTNLSLISSEEFNVGLTTSGVANAAIDLEYLALFPASITDDQADSVRNYINNRNNVFDLKDGFGYYFFESSATSNGQVFSSGAYPWNGRIVGSDNGDTNRYLFQETLNDRPTSDGYKITFADNTDHFNIASTTQAGWQIVGTSLGTFAYRVDNDAVTELNLLGNLGNASFRKAGDLYGIILLPESATGADIEAARKLLTDRGASDGATSGSYFAAWYARGDMVEFGSVDLSEATSLDTSWGSSALVKFSPTDISNCTNFSFSWSNCTSLNDFAPIQAPLGSNFASAWKTCSSLQSFPAGAKLGTSASSVNFTSAWQSSGLTSFPALDLSKGNNFSSAFQSSDLTSFPAGIDMSNGTNFANTWRDTDIVEFPLLNLDKSSIFLGSWRFNNLMTTFPAGFFDTWNPDSMNNYVFQYAFSGCVSLTSESVQNILVSINASGQYPTSDGNAGSSAITYKGIDIDYNVATGSLSAATNSAVDSLKSKGWSIVVNGVTL